MDYIENDTGVSFLYLDDIRTISPEYGATIVRNFEDFKSYIIDNGIPDIISFDHDLGEDIAKYKYENGILSKRQARIEKRNSKTGLDCANWLINYCIDNNLKLNKVFVHSANVVGAENIISVINNFKEFCEQDEDCVKRFWDILNK